MPERFFARTLIAGSEVAAEDVAVLRVFGVDAADEDADRANYADEDAADDADAAREN